MSDLELVSWIAVWGMFGAFVLELAISGLILRDGRYGVRDTAVTLAIAAIYMLTRAVLGFVIGVILLAIYELTPLRWSMDAWWHWVVLFLVEDFFYYWSHRASHTFEIMWAAHAVHHNSPYVNMSTGLRNSWLGGAIDWIFFVPAIALGFHPLAYFAVVGVASAWDFLTHTPYLGKVRWLDAWANTPSNHRVHHARNPRYVNKNLGGALIIWDRMFGTYAAEDERERADFGMNPMPARPNNPFYLEFYLWGAMIRRAFTRSRTA